MQIAKTLLFFLVLTCLVGVDAASAFPANDPSGEADTAIPKGFTSTSAELTTPELIEQAFRAGKIGHEQRLLLLAYAIFDYASLPESFRSDQPWDGTPFVRELDIVNQELMSGSPAHYSASLLGKLEQITHQAFATVCGEADMPNSYLSEHFYINYGKVFGGYSLQDYVNALEASYSRLIIDYEWGAPPFSDHNSWSRLPVQIAFLGSGLIGYTSTSSGDYTEHVGDNPNTELREYNSHATCMVLNDNFSNFVLGLNQLKATAAHEFNHVVQQGLGDGGSYWEDSFWHELTSAYVEDEIADSSNANYRHLWPNFDACLGEYGDDDYSNWPIFRYTAERYGGTNIVGGGEDIYEDMWSRISIGESGLDAFGNALATAGTTLPDLFHDYAITTRFMKTCPDQAPFCYEEAAGYLASAGSISPHGSIPSSPGYYTGGIRDHYSLNWVDLPLTGAYTVTLSNINAGGQLRGSIVAKTPSGLEITPFPYVVGNGTSTSLPSYTIPLTATRVSAVITNQTKISRNPAGCKVGVYRLYVDMKPEALSSYYLPIAQRAIPAITGRITDRGVPVAGSTVTLRRRNSYGNWFDEFTTTTNSDGVYSFNGQRPLTDRYQAMYVLWGNWYNIQDHTRLGDWYCDYIYYDSPEDAYSCSFDIENISMVSPYNKFIGSLPAVFSWKRRSTSSDSYSVVLYHSPETFPHWWSPPVGYTSGYRLDNLPNGFVFDAYYWWFMTVIGADGEGSSYYYRLIAFTQPDTISAPTYESVDQIQPRPIMDEFRSAGMR